MQPLATTQRVMTWLSMCPPDESSNERQKKAYVIHTFAVLFLNVASFIASSAFCLKFVSIDFNSATFAFMASIGELGLIYFMIAAILMCHNIGNIFTSLSTIYKSSKFDFIETIWKAKNLLKKKFNVNQFTDEKELAFRHLTRANNISERMWTIYSKFMSVSIGGVAATSLISVLYGYLTQGNFNTDHFYRPAKYVYVIENHTFSDYIRVYKETLSSLNVIPSMVQMVVFSWKLWFSPIFRHIFQK